MPTQHVRRRFALAGMLVIGAVAATTVSRAAAQDLPPDDGAPPEEYRPHPDARTLTVLNGRPASTLAVGDPGQSPPTDNAFPVSGHGRGSCTNSYGAPRGGDRIHLGVDCFAPAGTPLVAVESGTIRYATAGAAFACPATGDISGNRVSVRGRSGYVYYYGHLDQILVSEGQWVEKGQVIGTVGRTGNASCTTSHLHFEVKCGENGGPFDPYPVLGSWRWTGPPPNPLANTEGHGAGVAFSGPDRADIVALECSRNMHHRAWMSSVGLVPYWSFVGTTNSDPDVASHGAGALPEVFVRGDDSAAYQLWFTGSGWAASNLGGYCTSATTAVYSGPTYSQTPHLDVFCRGGDGAIYQRWYDASVGWSPQWYYIGGYATSDPDTAWPGPGYAAQIFIRSQSNTVHQIYWTGSNWSHVELGGYCTSAPTAAFAGDQRLDVYCRGGDMAIWHRQERRCCGWGNWERIEGSWTISAPEAATAGPGSPPQVWARGNDRRLVQFIQSSSGAWVQQNWGLT